MEKIKRGGGGMRKTILSILLLAACCWSSECIAKDSIGLVVEIREQYSTTMIDTCTVVMVHDGSFYIVKKTGLPGVYPVARHSVKILSRGE
jgi:hypothetical protein